MAAAHDIGLTYGKYRAYLAQQALAPDVTPEEVRDMTMRELRDRILTLSPGEEAESGASGPHGWGRLYGLRWVPAPP